MDLGNSDVQADEGFEDTPGVPVSQRRLTRAKAAYTTRRVELCNAPRLLTGDLTPEAGDVVLAQVQRLGQHRRIELATGRRAHLREGDEIIVTYGDRYAPDQFEAYVPPDFDPCDLVAAGGVASRCQKKHTRMKSPTVIRPIGLLADAWGRRCNLSTWSLPAAGIAMQGPPVIAVVGTMMNAGKTTCAADLVHGCKRKGLRVGAAKVTGTGSGGDRWALLDAGADEVLDFTDFGEPSTFGLSNSRVVEIFSGLIHHLILAGSDVIVLEIADGLCQRETSALLQTAEFQARCDGLIFAAGDALGALAGVQRLEALGHNVVATGGALSASPLATNEARQVLSVPVVTSRQLSTGRWLPPLVASLPKLRVASIEQPFSRASVIKSPMVKWISEQAPAQMGA